MTDIVSVEPYETAEPVSIYNLNVDEYHTYFVGNSRLLVHNDCTTDMMAAGREAIENARARNITDPRILSEVGSRAADAIGDAKAIGVTDAIQRISDNAAVAVINGRKFTEPTLPIGGKPKGNYQTPDPNYPDPITRQNQAADLLADNGYDIKMLPENMVDNPYGIVPGKFPDYLIDGVPFDCFSPETANVYNIWRTVQTKTVNQARRIVLNLDGFPGSMDDLVKQFYDWNHDLQTLDELLMIKNGKISRLIMN